MLKEKDVAASGDAKRICEQIGRGDAGQSMNGSLVGKKKFERDEKFSVAESKKIGRKTSLPKADTQWFA